MKLKMIFCSLFVMIILSFNGYAATEESITFAAFFNFSGPQSSLDTFAANGANLAVDSINKSGGLLGKKLNLLFLDGRSNPSLLAKLAQDVGKNPAINLTFGLTNTDMALAILPELTKANKFFMSSGATSPDLVKLYPKNVFLSCFSDEKQGKAAAQFAYEKLNVRKTLVLEEKNYEYAKILSQFYLTEWNNLNKENNSAKKIIVSFPLVPKTEIQEAIKTFQPDNIFVGGEPSYVVKIVQLLRGLNYNKPIVGGDSFDSKDMENLKVKDIYYTTHTFISAENADPIVQIFRKDYVEKFHNEPDGSFAALGFDTVYLLVHAVKLVHSTEPAKVAEALHKIKNHHLITGNITFVEKSNIPEKSLSIIKLDNGKKSAAGVVE